MYPYWQNSFGWNYMLSLLQKLSTLVKIWPYGNTWTLVQTNKQTAAKIKDTFFLEPHLILIGHLLEENQRPIAKLWSFLSHFPGASPVYLQPLICGIVLQLLGCFSKIYYHIDCNAWNKCLSCKLQRKTWIAFGLSRRVYLRFLKYKVSPHDPS